ncbi:DUF2306 domain-containing protein [Sphingorhabdus pulchriflava]|uniref:DUF2306 domain-containing protein n=1 Tax=Sphingorhabdus pulchriflava TaxID=2292257 RepID=UPI001EEFC6EB|nr:hypothetical protein [Sphingorhabdus pulchriflava]
MASFLNDYFGKRGTRYDQPVAPNRSERILGALVVVLLAAALAAVIKGRAQWGQIPWQVWVHLLTIGIALVITPAMMWLKRGDRVHRILGRIWAISMFVTAILSFDIRLINQGGLSYIHILSVITLVGVPVLVISARRRDLQRHRGQARGFVIGALLVAGFFTFPFNRLLGGWLFG